MDIFLGICIVGFIFLTYMAFRNSWVFRERMKLNALWFKMGQIEIQQGRFDRADMWLHYLDEYASYDRMMWKFWIWDVEKFRIKPAPDGRDAAIIDLDEWRNV